MNYFIISFSVVIDGANPELGSIGVTSSIADYKPNSVKRTVEEHYRKQYPTSKSITVVFTHVDEVSKEIYFEASKRFIRLI
jgi:glycine cleavage system protein P-like pyridoxal-binding family